jgi:hypothetical protein
MAMRFWNRTPAAVTQLQSDVRALTTAVRRLEEAHRKDAEQAKKLRQALAEATTTARESADASRTAFSDLWREIDARLEKHRAVLSEQVADGRHTDAKWRKIFSNQLGALVRHVCLPLDQLQPPFALNARRFRLRSQNEEDGILMALFAHAGWGMRRFVEIGSGKSGGNAAGLAHECGWGGLLIELSERSVELARKKFASNRLVTVAQARVTPDNINALLEAHGYIGDVDLLSIDIDSYDYWILEALRVVSPRVLVLEYNALFGPERRVTIPLDQPLDDTPKGYSGASLAALTELARRKGYRLVTCENAGVNAFFLRNDVAVDVPAVTPTEAFRPLRSRTELEDDEVLTDIYSAIQRRNLPLAEV